MILDKFFSKVSLWLLIALYPSSQVQQKAAKAKQDAEKTLKEVEALTALIMAVQEKLDNLDGIDGGDEDALDKLEKKLDMVSQLPPFLGNQLFFFIGG